MITANGVAVAGDNQSNLLEQLESAGLSIPYKCRSGMCGTCSVILESGSVDQDEVPAATRARQKGLDSRTIFACCAVPNQDIEIRY
ncbi:2Fe-2S iron-sulfur cluster-binding protein [Vibrio hippocampi]|uniref:2Fe-2S iron-sulfur cluster-binding protein n=1 Tax=Vibrio hippocampi TaxID=654686 RepID=UPI003F4A2040